MDELNKATITYSETDAGARAGFMKTGNIFAEQAAKLLDEAAAYAGTPTATLVPGLIAEAQVWATLALTLETCALQEAAWVSAMRA